MNYAKYVKNEKLILKSFSFFLIKLTSVLIFIIFDFFNKLTVFLAKFVFKIKIKIIFFSIHTFEFLYR